MTEHFRRIRWRIKHGGRGYLDLHRFSDVAPERTELYSRTIVFDSLDQIPQSLADAIRADGRAWGEIAA